MAVLQRRVERDGLGADLWPDFIEAAWDADPTGSRGLISVGVDIPLAGRDRSALADTVLRARQAEVQQTVTAEIAAATARLKAARAHLAALDRPLPAEAYAAAERATLDGLAIRETILRAQARRRDAAWAVEAALIDWMEAAGIGAP